MQKVFSKEKNKKAIPWVNNQNRSCSENKTTFDILFLRNDADQSVEAVESSIINFSEVVEHLRLGHSVFITPKSLCSNQIRRKQSKEQANDYVSHV